ncbi:hypothetical protein GCM10007094_06080 [Pseudovibrio japonicus]|uniref:Lipoprotein n=1 Tax=Pseudovibrio japonicus TaxID=366534 RepID=A0ABQ3DYY3_9HYPH|nr:hypothetical protein [Pseudovibrio japonicus]GHB20827.1 hypothetical protein GCM10007094_06080 [Pseudovibrio japonicus]
MPRLLLSAAVLVLFSAASAFAAPPPQVGDTSKGQTLTDDSGMTLYIYSDDPSGQSTCDHLCAFLWPPYEADEGASAEGDYSLVTRSDGTQQWAYDGKPLYTYRLDTAPGDISGDGVLNEWSVAQPSGS